MEDVTRFVSACCLISRLVLLLSTQPIVVPQEYELTLYLALIEEKRAFQSVENEAVSSAVVKQGVPMYSPGNGLRRISERRKWTVLRESSSFK